MQVDLDGKVALVTGGSQGIGRAIVQQLADNGAHVCIVDVDGEGAKLAAREIGGRSWLGDVVDVERMRLIVEEIVCAYGALHIVINNAGINTGGGRLPIHEFDVAQWDRIVEVDLKGVFSVSRAAVPALLQSGEGRVVNISSIAGLVPLRLQSAFVAAKTGVINLTRSMASELGPQGILVNAVALGSTLTRGTDQLFYGPDGSYSENAQLLLSHISLGRSGRVEEIAAAVLFLVAPESSYVNGTVLTVDGGWTAGYTRDW